jgi:mono/diheme cytochrome c family protein
MKILTTVILTILVLIVIALIFIYSGLYNVSAIRQDRGITRWVLNTTMDNSVEHYSRGITAPNLNDTAMIKEGLAHYKEMCEICHDAPGKEPSELSKGLNPHAPNLVRAGIHMDPVEVFWITKNGIKMTGMPAWGPTHSDSKIWAIVAAVKKLHDVSPQVYDSVQMENDADNSMQMNGKEDRPH